MADERIVLNIGGHRFEVSVATLLRHPGSLLGELFAPENRDNIKPDTNGEYFFDRNGRLFEVVLDYYRSGTLHIPPDTSRELLRRELEYFRLEVAEILQEDDEYDDQADNEDSSDDEAVGEESEREPTEEDKFEAKFMGTPAAALAKSSINDRFAKAVEFVHTKDRETIRVGLQLLEYIVEFIGALGEDLASDFEEMVYDAKYYITYANYRLGFVREARLILQGILKSNPSDKRAQDLALLLEDTGSAFAKGGLLFFGILVIGAVVGYRVYKARTGLPTGPGLK